MLDKPRALVRQWNSRIDETLDEVATLPPPPVLLSIQKLIAVSVPMQSSIASSVAFHVLAIFGVGFIGIDPSRFAPPHNVMDVVLVNAKSSTKPLKADALAQANLDGGGNTDEARRAKTPLPAVEQRSAKDEVLEAQEKVKQLEAQMKQLMIAAKAAAKIAQTEALQDKPQSSSTATADLMQKSIEIAKLEAQLAKEYEAYQQRPKKTFIGARTAEYRFAQYVDNWRLKIERVGNLNYPEEAKQRKIYGQLQLTVGIFANGDIESVEINRSSGHKVLDESAKRIVRLAAPFDRFPANIKRDTDILYITRTWYFQRGDTIEAK